MRNVWRVLLALVFFLTLPKRHLREPQIVEYYPVVKAASLLPDPEPFYRLPPPVVLYCQRDGELESVSNADTEWVRPAWGMFAITAVFAAQCVLDNGSSMIFISDRFLKNPIFIVSVSVYAYLLRFGPRFSLLFMLAATTAFAAVLALLY